MRSDRIDPPHFSLGVCCAAAVRGLAGRPSRAISWRAARWAHRGVLVWRRRSERDIQFSRRAAFPAEPLPASLTSLGLGHEPALAVRLACLHPPPPGCTGLWTCPARISCTHAWCDVRRPSAYNPRCALLCVRYERRMRPVRSLARTVPLMRLLAARPSQWSGSGVAHSPCRSPSRTPPMHSPLSPPTVVPSPYKPSFVRTPAG